MSKRRPVTEVWIEVAVGEWTLNPSSTALEVSPPHVTP